MDAKRKKTVIVIGAGYGGLRTVAKLDKKEGCRVLLFDKNSYHFMQTDVYELIANEKDFAQVSVDLFTYCSGLNDVSFHKEEIIDIDFANKRLISNTNRYLYDYLVIAVGAKTKFTSKIKGLLEYAHDVKSLPYAMHFKQQFEMSLFKKVQESGTVCQPLSIVIVGAGLSGVEIAAQMASFAKEFYCANNFLCRKLNIVLISSGKEILKGLDSYLVEQSEKVLRDLDIKIRYSVRVSAVNAGSVELDNGDVINMDFMLFAGGIEPSGLLENLQLKKNERGFLSITKYLQVQGYEDVFAIGDCATLFNGEKLIVPTADVAEQMADICTTNIMRSIAKVNLIEHNISSRGILIALGRRRAVGKIAKLHIRGYIAFVMKKLIEKAYLYRLNFYAKRGCRKIFNK